MEDMTKYRNFHIFNTGNSFVVKADSKRFGKQAIVYENFDLRKCVSWIYSHYRNDNGKIITNRRWTDHMYCKAMSTCNCADNPWFKGGRNMKHLNIHSMDGNIGKFALDLEIIKENSKSIYAEGMYGNVYRVVKKTGSVYIDGEKYADNSSYSIVD